MKKENLLDKKFCFDSRKVKSGCVFVAIRGERYDGHNFVEDALKRGADLALVERDVGIDRQIVVENVVRYLINLASEKLKADVVIGVTGSSGKTFTKEVLASVIPDSFKNSGNMNTEIGLPISILNSYRGERVAILEMGMNKAGDIRKLCEIRKPDVGIVLNVGRQHLGFFSSEKDLFKSKMEMFECSEKLVYNADDPRMREWVEKLGKISVGFGRSFGICTLIDWMYSDFHTKVAYEVEGKELRFSFGRILHEGHLLNIAASLCTLKLLNMPLNLTELVELPTVSQRFHVFSKRGILFIDDTYNASLISFERAVDAMLKLKGRRIAVVGPILEQGRYARETHEMLSNILERLNGTFVLDGFEESEYINPRNLVYRSSSKEELTKFVAKYLKPGDVVLFKASRGVKMEEVLKRVIGWI